MPSLPQRLLRDEDGATMVEYGLMVALISIAIAVTVMLLSAQLNIVFEVVLNCIQSPTSTSCSMP